MRPRISPHIALYDDAKRVDARNGAPASAAYASEMIGSLDSLACRFRPTFNFFGGSDAINRAALLHQNRLDVSPGSIGMSMTGLVVPSVGSPSDPQRVTGTVGATTLTMPMAIGLRADPSRAVYPRDAVRTVRANFDAAPNDSPHAVTIGSEGANGPQIRSGVFYERWNFTPTDPAPPDAPQVLPTDSFRPGGNILGREASFDDIHALAGLRDYYRRVIAGRRLAFGVAFVAGADGTEDDGCAKLNLSPTNYRYILDQNTGQGGGATAPSPTGRGITIPLQFSACGLRTRIRLYFSVRARMATGAGGTGTFATYSLDDAGAMTGPTAMVNGPSVTGTTWQWYGWSSPFDPAADSYFLGNAVRKYDRVLPCGKSTSVGDFLQVSSFSVAAFHSVL